MFPFYFLKIAKDSGCGLCNQLYALSGCIDYAIYTKQYQIIIVDDFLKEIHTNNFIPLREILDVPCFQHFLFKKYQLLIFDKNNLEITIASVFYVEAGEKKKTIEIKIDSYIQDNTFFISKNTPIIDFLENYESKNGTIHVHINMNNIPVVFSTIVTNGYLEKNIHIDSKKHLEKEIYLPSPQLYFGGSFQPNVFVTLLQNIPFHNSFHEYNEKTMNKMIVNYKLHSKQKINLIHLRLEEDAILSFSNEKQIPKDVFKKKMEDKYIQLIKKYIDKEDFTIVIANDYDNSVVDFLHSHNYCCSFSKKMYPYRECNAIHDLLFYKYCNHVFIGVYESSFSYTVMYKLFMKENFPLIRSVIFKMNEVNKPETIFTKNSSVQQIRQG
jgi:hypothetical protein